MVDELYTKRYEGGQSHRSEPTTLTKRIPEIEIKENLKALHGKKAYLIISRRAKKNRTTPSQRQNIHIAEENPIRLKWRKRNMAEGKR